MPTAFIVCGSPGAGKTTHATKLATERRAVLLDIDTATERLVRLALAEAGHDPDDRDSPAFKQRFRQPIYDTLFDIAAENLPWLDVIIAGPFTRELRDEDWPDHLQTRLGAPVEVHYVYCRPEDRRQRLIRRGNPRDAAKLADWDNYLDYYEDEAPPVFPHVFVDTSNGYALRQ